MVVAWTPPTSPSRAPRRPTASTASTPTASGWRRTSGATPTPRRCCASTGGSTSPGPTTSSPRCWPAGGWRVVSWDQRGHGDSDRAPLYSWDADLRDALAVFDHVSPGRPVPVVGHSKGGGMMIQLGDAQPYRISSFVNLDGVPYASIVPDVAEHNRTKMMAQDVEGWLEHRRRTATQQPQARHARGAGPAAGQDEPPPVAGVAAVPGVGRRPPGRGRLALEDRPHHALRRLRPVAPGVDGAQAARAADAVPRHPRQPTRGDGLGHRPGAGVPVPPAGRSLRDPRHRPLRAHRAADAGVAARPRPRRAEH